MFLEPTHKFAAASIDAVISGHASAAGTEKYARSFGAGGNFNRVNGLHLSNVGVGTYLGDADSATDGLVEEAVKRSVKAGINVIDTAINYRGQKAERSVGRAVSGLVSAGTVARDQVFVSTKGGYVTNDADVPGDFWGYVNSEYIQKGIIKEGQITPGYHCMTVPHLKHQLERSLDNLGMDCIDLLYLHNAVEGQAGMPRDEFLKRLEAVFEMYEDMRREGVIRYYGMATWDCFRAAAGDPQHLQLADAMRVARDVGGDVHGFRFIQLPFNLHYDQALLAKNQDVGGERLSILDAAMRLGVGVFTSVPFMQGRLLQPGVMPEFSNLAPPLRALQFIRSTPGVLAPLVGQKSVQHVDENLGIMEIPPMFGDEHAALVKSMMS